MRARARAVGAVGAEHGLGAGALSGHRGVREAGRVQRSAAETIREQGIDCVLSLFRRTTGGCGGRRRREYGKTSGLCCAGCSRSAGAVASTLRSCATGDSTYTTWTRAWWTSLDGHIFCNREKLEYWSRPVAEGGRGVDVFGDEAGHLFVDGDMPKLEFMNDRFSDPLSESDGEVHTVCVGRPLGIDFLAAARCGIHVHVYSNSFDDVYRTIAGSLPVAAARRARPLLDRHLHVHEPLQPAADAGWERGPRARRRDGSRSSRATTPHGRTSEHPFAWDPLDDRAAIPNRLGTYLLAGLPVISDRGPGFYRYDLLRRLGGRWSWTTPATTRFEAGSNDEVATRERRDQGPRGPAGVLVRRDHRRAAGRARGRARALLRSSPTPPGRDSTPAGGRTSPLLQPRAPAPATPGDSAAGCWLRFTARALGAGPRARRMTIATLERFADPSRRCEPPATAPPRCGICPACGTTRPTLLRSVPGAVTGWLGGGIPRGRAAEAAAGMPRHAAGPGSARWRARPTCGAAPRRGRSTGSPSSRRRTSPSPSCWPSGSAARPSSCSSAGTKYLGEFAFELLAVDPLRLLAPPQRAARIHDLEPRHRRALLLLPAPRGAARPAPLRPDHRVPRGRGRALHYDRFAFPRHASTPRAGSRRPTRSASEAIASASIVSCASSSTRQAASGTCCAGSPSIPWTRSWRCR